MAEIREIERRWLVKSFDRSAVAKHVALTKYSIHEIEQAYLDVPGQLRVRVTTVPDLLVEPTEAELTRKAGKGIDRLEKTAFLSVTAARMLIETTPLRIRKTRHLIDGWELDFFHDQLEGLVLLEYEYKGDKPVDQIEWPELPSWVSDAVEVTETLSNRQLAVMAHVLGDEKASIGSLTREIPRYVLTGGPCGGKSTIIESLRKDGEYHCVPEIATILMGQIGITPEVGEATFQRTLYRIQRTLEEAALKQAIKNGKKGVILDRGTLDSAAFVKGGLPAYCELVSTTRDSEYENYDGIFLIGIVDRDIYEANKASNPVRRESWEQATEVHKRLYSVWFDHPHANAVKGSRSLEEKEAFVRQGIARIESVRSQGR